MTISRRSPGQALVETAVSLLVFLLLTLGVVDAARAAWSYNTVSFLARDGARYGIIAGHDVASYVSNRCTQFGLAGCTVVAPPATCGALRTVTVSYEFTPATPVISAFWGESLALSATSQMYTEKGLGCP
jgi:Flp pilus assembly protein TadG